MGRVIEIFALYLQYLQNFTATLGNWQDFQHYKKIFTKLINAKVSLRCTLSKVGLSPYKKNCFICFKESPIKMMKKKLFCLKSSFPSQDI